MNNSLGIATNTIIWFLCLFASIWCARTSWDVVQRDPFEISQLISSCVFLALSLVSLIVVSVVVTLDLYFWADKNGDRKM